MLIGVDRDVAMEGRLPSQRVFTPRSITGWGPTVWRSMVLEMIGSRELIWRLFLRDLSAKYRQSVLGVLWAVLLPVIAVSTFMFLSRAGLLNVGDVGVPYALFALVGLVLWQTFTGGLIACSNAVVGGGSIVVKIYFAKKALVVAALGQVLFELVVRVVVVAIFLVIYGYAPKWTVVLLPFTVAPLLLLVLGLGFYFSLLNVLIRDTGSILNLLTMFLMFLTPVLYPVPASGLLGTVMGLNPMGALIVASRDLVFHGHLSAPGDFAWATVLSVLIFLTGWRVFHAVEPRIAERL